MPQVFRLADVPRSITWDEVRARWKQSTSGLPGDGAMTPFFFGW
jgi:hypothetical protein